MEVDLNKILVATWGAHMLYLYSPDVDKHDIQSAFLSLIEDGTVAYISDDDPNEIKSALPGVEIVKPEKLGNIKASGVIFDAGSIKGDKLKYESILSKLKAPTLCTYPVSSIKKNDLERLVSCHSHMVMLTGSTAVISSKNLDEIKLSEENINKWIKKNLETIVLALLIKKPMSGKDIIKTIHGNSGILLSPGRVYPLLHDLNQRKLLTFEYNIRDKIYKPTDLEEVEEIMGRELRTGQLVISKFSALELG